MKCNDIGVRGVTGLAGFLASLIYPVLRYLKPIAPQEGAGALRLSQEEVTKLEKEHSLIVRHGAKWPI